jgi:hypothetical protein
MLMQRRTNGHPHRAALFFFVICLIGPACHSSCTEETGAAPVVEVDAGPVLGATRAPTIAPRRPTIQRIPLTAAPSSSAAE